MATSFKTSIIWSPYEKKYGGQRHTCIFLFLGLAHEKSTRAVNAIMTERPCVTWKALPATSSWKGRNEGHRKSENPRGVIASRIHNCAHDFAHGHRLNTAMFIVTLVMVLSTSSTMSQQTLQEKNYEVRASGR